MEQSIESSHAPKVKHFMWRLITGCLPIVSNLQRRGLNDDPLCCVCTQHVKNIYHAFFDCIFCKNVWSLVDDGLLNVLGTAGSVIEIWKIFIQRAHEKRMVERFCIVCWHIWRNRNLTFHEQCCGRPRGVVQTAERMHDEFKSKNRYDRLELGFQQIRWTPPPDNVIKLNVDASFSQITSEALRRVMELWRGLGGHCRQ